LFSEPDRFNPLKNYVKGERQKRGVLMKNIVLSCPV
jgi:hypothetical protein